MKFKDYIKKNKLNEVKNMYVDYKKLKRLIKKKKFREFWILVDYYLDKIILNKSYFRNNIWSFEDINKYINLNLMIIFKALKVKNDKLCKKLKDDLLKIIINKKLLHTFHRDFREKKPIKLAIFDKDGTLIDFKNVFEPILKNIIQLLSTYIEEPDNAYTYLGYDNKKNTFNSDSVLAKGTNRDISDKLIEYLHLKNPDLDELFIQKYVELSMESIEFNSDHIKPCGNLHKIMQHLKDNNIKIAICTSDDRKPTMETIKLLKLEKYIDHIICGDDVISNKPSPEPIWNICWNLDVLPSETIMIGDTISDIKAGLNSGCGYVLGVLTGNYETHELKRADKILNNVDEVPNFIVSLQNNNDTIIKFATV